MILLNYARITIRIALYEIIFFSLVNTFLQEALSTTPSEEDAPYDMCRTHMMIATKLLCPFQISWISNPGNHASSSKPTHESSPVPNSVWQTFFAKRIIALRCVVLSIFSSYQFNTGRLNLNLSTSSSRVILLSKLSAVQILF